jgi:hypothetical protein
MGNLLIEIRFVIGHWSFGKQMANDQWQKIKRLRFTIRLGITTLPDRKSFPENYV